MARKRINKAAVVRTLLDSDMKNAAIADAVKAKYKIAISPAYVAIIRHKHKSNGQSAQRVRRDDPLAAAIQFVRAAGGIESAKQALRTIEEIKQLA